MTKCTFLGLGVMGYPMAGYLAKAGHEVCVYNRTSQKAEKWVGEYGGTFAATPAEAAQGAAFVFACVGNDDDLRSVTIGEGGAFEGIGEDAVFVDHTTTSAIVARELDDGVLTVMCGGGQAGFDRAAPLIDAYARACRLMGPVGAGQLTKMVNQICIAGLLQALSEGMAFAQTAGLDGEAVLDVISKGAAGSWQMENRGKTMLADQFDFGFAIDWMRKDLGICLEEANANGASLPVTAMVDQYYKDVQNMGGGRNDTSALMRRLTQLGS